MSMDNVEKFYEALKADKAMAEAFRNASSEAKLDTPQQAKDFVVKYAADKGFPFTQDDLKAFEKEAKELSPEELDSVNAAGGGACFVIGGGWGQTNKWGAAACRILGFGIAVWDN